MSVIDLTKDFVVVCSARVPTAEPLFVADKGACVVNYLAVEFVGRYAQTRAGSWMSGRDIYRFADHSMQPLHDWVELVWKEYYGRLAMRAVQQATCWRVELLVRIEAVETEVFDEISVRSVMVAGRLFTAFVLLEQRADVEVEKPVPSHCAKILASYIEECCTSRFSTLLSGNDQKEVLLLARRLGIIE
jgi:hypothetical protein